MPKTARDIGAGRPAVVGFLLTLGLFSLLSGTILGAYGQFQAPSTLQGKTVVIPIGTTFEGRIDTTIGSACSHQGERFVISTSSPILANGVEVLIPAGSEVIGEVVEAIPSHKVPHQKSQGKQIGKLRVQLTALKTPDGLTFPLVASIVPDKSSTGFNGQGNPLGTGVAYVGVQSSFEAVSPGNPKYARTQRGQAPRVASPSEIMRDPILGRDQSYANSGFQNGSMIRSLVRKKNDLFIYSGSPISMRIDAPFKLSVSSSPGAAASLDAPVPPGDNQTTGGRRFSKEGSGEKHGADANSLVNTNSNVPKALPTAAHNVAPASVKDLPSGEPRQPVRKHDPNDSEF